MLESNGLLVFIFAFRYMYYYVFLLFFGAGRCVSLDCEMVGIGPAGDFSMLARCSIVNHHGNVLYDSYVAPMDKIIDYQTEFSRITPQLLRGGTCIIVILYSGNFGEGFYLTIW